MISGLLRKGLAGSYLYLDTATSIQPVLSASEVTGREKSDQYPHLSSWVVSVSAYSRSEPIYISQLFSKALRVLKKILGNF